MSQTSMACFKCGQPITFKKGVMNKWGKPQQLNLDGVTEHWKTCAGRPQNAQPQPQTQQPTTTATTTSASNPSTEALLQLILLEQRTNFEKINGKLEALTTNLAAISELLKHQHQV